MNENNIAFLAKQVKYTGFGDNLEHKIRENIADGKDGFQLSFKPDFGGDRAEATLNFRKSTQDNYFFNSYDLKVKPENGEPLTQNFKIIPAQLATVMDKDGKAILDAEGNEQKDLVNNTYTLKEAFNMMDVNQKGEGRAVLKDFVNKKGEKHTFWNKLDFSSKDQRGNYETKTFKVYELESKLAQFPIKELGSDESKKQLIQSLERGNRQTVTMELPNGTEYKRQLEANPQFKTINLYDGNQRVKHQTVKQSEDQQQNQSEAKGKFQKETSKAALTTDGDGSPAKEKKGRTSKKTQGIS